MGRSANALLLLFLLCFVAMVATSEHLVDEELEASLASAKHKHKHSGLSDAECPGACQFRCSKTQYKKPCLFFCQKCCYTCKCVPPGTYANKEKCPCYNNWKTKRGGPKCP
ncbi:gibberellin-regulated protein 12-like isoform X2 [Asparagus officinalis]|uniref:gibberellin-regulated protein 12-like isoform X2 n=1 Tax=Asparagus officinalis TaxID=4686 RepID=UPI00098E55AF|nr:gibberellin-regulated protein 12-like isoform X2 [Asparagus officinalis]